MRKNAFLFVFMLVFAYFSYAEEITFEKKDIALIDSKGIEHKISAEIARSDKQKAQGFMWRKKIPDGTGMLFVEEKDRRLSFWMKNTLVPLSIAFISADGTIRDIFDMKAQSEKSIRSSISVRYALEVPQGYFAKIGIKEGDRLKIEKRGF